MLAQRICFFLWLGLCVNTYTTAQVVLTGKPWHLYQKCLADKKSLIHKATDEDFIFNFQVDGTLLCSRYKGKKQINYTWEWVDKNHKEIRTIKKGKTMTFEVTELNSEKLVWRIKVNTSEIYEFVFKHPDDPEWLKEDVDAKNAARKDSVLIEKMED